MEKLDLLLVNPSERKKIYQDLSNDFSAIEPPFWAALTAGFVRKKGYEVSILDANAGNFTHKETAEEIKKLNPKLVNIVVYGQHPSASTQLMDNVGELCKEIKCIDPLRKIILSGLHPSSLPRRTIKEEECDYVCQGEGFYTLEKLLEKSPLNKIDGLWWKEDNQILNNPHALNVENLTAQLGNVAWDLLSLKEGKYRAHNWQCLDDLTSRPNYASISTSLGCPFKCDFCSIHQTFGERKVRYWEPKWVADQIETLNKEHNVKIFKIIDEMFILNPKHYIGIAEELIKRNLGNNLNIWAYSRVDTVKEEHLEKLRKAGFKWLCFGFESGNENILKEIHKGKFTRKDMIDINKKVQNSGINVLGNYMFGFPEDTLETMQETLNLALEQNCEFANFYCTTPWPGSKLYDEVIKKGIELPISWKDYAQHSYGFIPLSTNHLSSKEVLRFRDNAFNKYFTNPKYLNMIEKKFSLEARKHIEGMTKYQLKRKLLEK